MAKIDLTADNFKSVIEQNETVLVDFWAEWCGPCQMLMPIIEEIAEERSDITVGKVNVDDQMDIAKEFGITSIPTLLVFKNGEKTDMSIGYKEKSEIEKML